MKGEDRTGPGEGEARITLLGHAREGGWAN